MDWVAVVSGAITGVVVSLVLRGFVRSSHLPPTVLATAIELRYPPALRVLLACMGMLCLGVFVALAVVLVMGNSDQKLVRLAWIGAPVCVVFGIPCWCEPRVRLWLDSDGIRGQTAFRGWRELAWHDIAAVRYSQLNSCFVLRSRQGGVLRVSRYLRGHQALLEALLAKVPPELWVDAMKRYQGHAIV